jgi:hypothetical protein
MFNSRVGLNGFVNNLRDVMLCASNLYLGMTKP